MSRNNVRVLQVAASDITISKLLLPLIKNLKANGYEVDSACADGRFAQELAEEGYVIHTLPMSRSISPWRTMKAVWALYRLLRKERYDSVHVHTPVAAGVGRLAARLAGVTMVIYTAHGFYFHDHMKPWAKRVTVMFERMPWLRSQTPSSGQRLHRPSASWRKAMASACSSRRSTATRCWSSAA